MEQREAKEVKKIHDVSGTVYEHWNVLPLNKQDKKHISGTQYPDTSACS